MNQVVKTMDDVQRLGIVARVVVALVLRETKTRFGRNQLGIIWAIVEPAAYVAVFIAIRLTLNSVIPFGENLALFMLTGLLTFRMFSSVSTRGVNALTANKALLTYPPVRPNDIIFARILLETLIFYFIFVVFYGFMAILSTGGIIAHTERFFGALATLTLLSASVATFNAVICVLFPFWERIWGMVRLPVFLLSGIFYVPKSLPPYVQDILWWNPVLHCVEFFRHASYLSYDPLLSLPYLLVFSLTALMLALLAERVNRYKMFET